MSKSPDIDHLTGLVHRVKNTLATVPGAHPSTLNHMNGLALMTTETGLRVPPKQGFTLRRTANDIFLAINPATKDQTVVNASHIRRGGHINDQYSLMSAVLILHHDDSYIEGSGIGMIKTPETELPIIDFLNSDGAISFIKRLPEIIEDARRRGGIPSYNINDFGKSFASI